MPYEEAPMDTGAAAPAPPAAKEPEGQSGPVEFRPPKGFKPPEGGDKEWDMVCTFKSKPDGSVCLTKLGDTPMPCDDEAQEKEGASTEKPSYSAYAKPIMSAIGGEGGQA